MKGTGHYVLNNMEEAQTMQLQVISILTACPHNVVSDFWNVSNGVKRWTRRLKGKGTDKDHYDFMMSKFQCHMEDSYFIHPWLTLVTAFCGGDPFHTGM